MNYGQLGVDICQSTGQKPVFTLALQGERFENFIDAEETLFDV